MAGELITADGQLEFKGYLLGDDEVTFMDSLQGWDDIPSVDSGNTPRPSSHGAWVGYKFANQRIITWEGRFAADPDDWSSRLKELRSVFTLPFGTEEDAIIIRSHDETLLAFGAVSARAIPLDRAYGYYGANLTLQFECSDPRRYSLQENYWELALPEMSENGLSYPLTYPLDYGIESSSTSGTLTNDGDMLTPVIINFVGPMEHPGLVNSTLGVKLEFNITLADTDTLTIDTRTGTVLLNEVSDRLYTRTVNSSPIFSFGLLPGDNDIQLTANDWSVPAGANLTWRDATL